MNMLIKLDNQIAKYLLTTLQNFLYGKFIFYLKIYEVRVTSVTAVMPKNGGR